MLSCNKRDELKLPISFYDEAGTLTAPTSAKYRIDEAETGTAIRAATVINPIASQVTLTLTGDDNDIVVPSRRQEEHVVTVTWVFGTDGTGDARQKTDQYRYMVRNIDNAV